ncbi:hypothetical protein Tco_1123174 [Tanacetum coccineum]|uniref:Uncharacterized protein n=1 Tax=Tanacetum coccineum TaxID=301880 RepID=A0ABQ5J2L3_9ASTR
MTTLAEYIIVAGAENCPPMLEKSMYDSWASRIHLFIKWKKHGRMMLDSIDNSSLVYPTVKENGQTRPKKYSELTKAQQLQDDCDVQETNIILHGLPPDGETLYEYYWRFSQLINDMHTIGMTMQQVQVNTKFQNALPSEWSKFVTDQPFKMVESPFNKFKEDKIRVILVYGKIGYSTKKAKECWFKEKLMLVEAREADQILDEEQLAFLIDPDDLDAYDIDCNDLSLAKAVLMANLLSCDSEDLSKIMATSAIVVSSDSFDESVGSLPSRVILFVAISTVISSILVIALEISATAPVALVVEMTVVAPPNGLRDLILYLDFDSDSPDEMASPEHISLLLVISPFLCTNSSKASDSSDGPPSQDPYVMVVARWRRKVASHPPSSSEFPIAPVTASPRIHRWSVILIRPGEAIPFDRPYRTYLNGPRKLLTARKRVGPIPTRRIAWRCVSPRALDHRSFSSSSSSDSSPVHSSSLDAHDQAHSRSSTRVISPRLVYPLRPLHSSSHSAGPSRKRCRSPYNSVPSSTLVMGSLAPTRDDLLLPRKTFRDSYSSEASMEEDIKVYTTKTEVDIELAPIVEEEIVEPDGEYSSDLSRTRDGIVKSFEDMPIDLDDVVRDFYHHMSEVFIDRIVEIETIQRQLEADQVIASRERSRMVERIESLRLENLKVRALLGIERDHVDNLRLHMSCSQEEFRQIREDRDEARRRFRRLESFIKRRLGFCP